MEMQRVGAATDDSQKKKDPKYDHEERFVSATMESGAGNRMRRGGGPRKGVRKCGKAWQRRALLYTIQCSVSGGDK